nr:uncharacterized protein LOC116829381 [Chelonoidis abingdonii]
MASHTHLFGAVKTARCGASPVKRHRPVPRLYASIGRTGARDAAPSRAARPPPLSAARPGACAASGRVPGKGRGRPGTTGSILRVQRQRIDGSECHTQAIPLQAILLSLDILLQDKSLFIHLLVNIPIHLFLEASLLWEVVHILQHHRVVGSQELQDTLHLEATLELRNLEGATLELPNLGGCHLIPELLQVLGLVSPLMDLALVVILNLHLKAMWEVDQHKYQWDTLVDKYLPQCLVRYVFYYFHNKTEHYITVLMGKMTVCLFTIVLGGWVVGREGEMLAVILQAMLQSVQ